MIWEITEKNSHGERYYFLLRVAGASSAEAMKILRICRAGGFFYRRNTGEYALRDKDLNAVKLPEVFTPKHRNATQYEKLIGYLETRAFLKFLTKEQARLAIATVRRGYLAPGVDPIDFASALIDAILLNESNPEAIASALRVAPPTRLPSPQAAPA